LVELYYAGRMVVSVTYTRFLFNPGDIQQVLSQDPRRIRYELVISGSDMAQTGQVIIGTSTAIDDGTAQVYSYNAGVTIQIERDFRSDMEGVCLPLFCEDGAGGTFISVRETFLTPLPIDEEP
jgi:hypothetical protein